MPSVTNQVNIRVNLTGNDTYRKQIADLKKHTELFKNELQAVENAFKGNNQSMDYFKQKGQALNNLLSAQRLEYQKLSTYLMSAEQKQKDYARQLDQAKQHLDKAKKALDDYNKSGQQDEQTSNRLNQVVAEAKVRYDEIARSYNGATKEVIDYSSSLSKLQTEMADTERAIEQNNDAMQNFHKHGKDVEEAVNKMAEVLALNELAGKFNEIKDALMDCANAAADFESAFTDVTKTVDGSEEQMAKLKEDILVMSSELPYTAEEIANISSIGGQLGVTIDDLSEFTQIMLGLGSATTLTAEDASTMVAQFQNITGLGSDSLSNFASALVELGNNSATTETKIMEMAQRMSSSATMAGMSETQILGLATALSSVGIESSMGGTAVQKMIEKIQEAYHKGGKSAEKYAKVMGVSTTDFKKIVETDMGEAINLLIKGIGSSEDAYTTFADDLGINEARLKQSMMALATSQKDASYYTEMANSAWEENIALQEEVGRKLDTTESKNKIIENSYRNLKIAIGEQLNPVITSFKEGMGDIARKVTQWVKDNPKLVKQIGTIVMAIAGVSSGLLGVVGAIKLISTAVSVLSAHPVFALISAVALATAGLAAWGQTLHDDVYIYKGSVDDYTKGVNEVKESVKAYGDEMETTIAKAQMMEDEAKPLIDRLKALEKQEKLTKDEQKEYADIIEKLQRIYPDLNFELDKETGMLKDGAEALEDQVKNWREKIELQAKEKYIESLYEQKYKNQADIKKTEKQRDEAQTRLDGALGEYDKYVGVANKYGYSKSDVERIFGDIGANQGDARRLMQYMGFDRYNKLAETYATYHSILKEVDDINIALNDMYETDKDISSEIDGQYETYEDINKVVEPDPMGSTEKIREWSKKNQQRVEEETRKLYERVNKKLAEAGTDGGYKYSDNLKNTIMANLDSFPAAVRSLLSSLAKNLGVTIPVTAKITGVTGTGKTYTINNNNQEIRLYSTGSNDEKLIEAINKNLGNNLGKY